jgi:flagellar motor switch protein FliN
MSERRAVITQEAALHLASALEKLLATLGGRATVSVREGGSAERLAAAPGPAAELTFRLTRGAGGPGALVLPGPAALGLARLLLGMETTGAPDTPGPEEEDALRELANQVGSAMATSLGGLLGMPVGVEGQAAQWLPAGGLEGQRWADAVGLRLNLDVGGVEAEAFLLLPRTAVPAPPQPSVLEASLPPLPETPGRQNGNGIEMLLDISLPVAVELGRTRMMIRDILHLAPGSILELDKQAGEPVDVLINDKPIARGEVVVVDESFGVRLTSIVSPSERVINLR